MTLSRIIPLALAAVAAAVLYAILGPLLRAPDEATPQVAAPSSARANASSPHTSGEAASIADDAWGLPYARAARAAPGPSAGGDADIAPTKLGLVLLGTTIDDDPSRSSALIRNTAGASETVSPGDPVADGRATVERVERARVLIDVDGRLESVVFAPKRTVPGGLDEAAVQRLQNAPFPGKTPPLARNEIANSTAQERRTLAEFDARIREMGTLEPVRAEDGSTSVRVKRIARGSALEQMGLQAGDEILDLNGIPVGGSIPPVLFQRLREGIDPVLTVRRASGELTQLRIPPSLMTVEEPPR